MRKTTSPVIGRLIGTLAISIALLTGGCGQKGDLYHPERGQQSSLSSLSSLI